MNSEILTIALSKGRLAEQALGLLQQCGVDVDAENLNSRQLIFESRTHDLRFFLAKPSDVPTYVEYGAADLGFVGKDTLLEENRQLYEVADLGFGQCRMCVCGPEALKGNLDSIPFKVVGTKYPRIAREYFGEVRRETVEIIKLNGSVELAPLIGLADVIVDIVESGRTLKENNLTILETITDISARLVVNRVNMKMKAVRVQDLIARVRAALRESGEGPDSSEEILSSKEKR